MATVALLTDFGTQDSYVGVMKGVMRGICPDADFIDITHAVARQNVRDGSLTLLKSYRYFPEDTIFLVVVDPGVGTTRRPVAVRAGSFRFVAPDNGVLSYVLAELESPLVVELNKPRYRLPRVSQTFHGRDIFAPAAAHLAAGVAVETIGQPISDWHRLPLPLVELEGTQIRGEIVQIDVFGNAATSIGRLWWQTDEILQLNPYFSTEASQITIPARSTVRVREQAFQRICHTYGSVPPGDPLVLIGSNNALEIAVNQGSAADQLGLQVGDSVELAVG